jgi:hypothetical protein
MAVNSPAADRERVQPPQFQRLTREMPAQVRLAGMQVRVDETGNGKFVATVDYPINFDGNAWFDPGNAIIVDQYICLLERELSANMQAQQANIFD